MEERAILASFSAPPPHQNVRILGEVSPLARESVTRQIEPLVLRCTHHRHHLLSPRQGMPGNGKNAGRKLLPRLPSPVNRLPLWRDLCIFGQETRKMAVSSYSIRAFSWRKPCILPDLLSASPLFSYTSPEVPSFLTSLGFHGSFRTMNGSFVDRANGGENPQIGNRPSKIGNPKSALDPRPLDPDERNSALGVRS